MRTTSMKNACISTKFKRGSKDSLFEKENSIIFEQTTPSGLLFLYSVHQHTCVLGKHALFSKEQLCLIFAGRLPHSPNNTDFPE